MGARFRNRRAGGARRCVSGDMRASLLALLVVSAGCGGSTGELPADDRPFPLSPAGASGPVVLSPRHRTPSAAPLLVLVTPGDPGPVEFEFRMAGRGVFRLRTKDRTMPWPANWAMLEEGACGTIRARSAAGIAYSAFVRAPFDEPRSGPRARSALARGLPVDALRRLAADPPPDPETGLEAGIRAGWPGLPRWRDH